VIVIPSVDIKDGRCVKLIRGKPGSGRVISDDPLEVAKSWEEEGAEILHLIDLDAAISGDERNREIIKHILAEMKIPVEVGGGIRTVEKALALLEAGAEWVIMGTAAVENPTLVSEVAEVINASHLILAIDSEGARVLTRGWTQRTQLSTEEAVKWFRDLKLAAFLYTDVKVEGTLRGIDDEGIRRLIAATETPIIYSGGITSLQDVRTLAQLGLRGAVVGRALYDGHFTLREAIDVVQAAACSC